MLARERLTGLKPPRGAARLIELWRPFVEEKAGADLDRLSDALLDQRAYARLVRKLLTSLGMASDSEADSEEIGAGGRGEQPPEDADEAARRGRGPEGRAIRCSARRPTTRRTTPKRARWIRSRRRRPSSRTKAMREKPKRRRRTVRRSRPTQERRGPDYKAYTTRFDEIVDADELCDADELQRLREYLDKQLQNLSTVVAPARQPAAAAADGAAEPLLGVRSRRGRARHRAPAARRSSTRSSRCPSSARRTWSSATRR